MKKTILITMLVLIVLSSSVVSVGISGADLRKTIQFEPDKEQTIFYFAISTSDKEITYRPTALPETSVDISEYIYFEPRTFTMKPKARKAFKAIVKMPSSLDAGKHGARICIEETETGSEMVNVKTSACAFIYIDVSGEGSQASQKKAAPKIIKKTETTNVSNETIAPEKTEEEKPANTSKKSKISGIFNTGENNNNKLFIRALALVVAALAMIIMIRKMRH